MPVHRGTDSKGSYFQWGNHGKKYYYKTNSVISRQNAKDKAALQGRAARAAGWKGH
jgi:hypothetical protein